MSRILIDETNATHLAENIALLWATGENVEPPTQHDQRKTELDEGRLFTTSQERQLASDIAFIATTTDDYKDVMAACIEEDVGQTGLTVRLASNSGDLSNVESRLGQLVRCLADHDLRKSREASTTVLLNSIVAFDRQRILSRLRSKHTKSRKAKVKAKQPMTETLLRALGSVDRRLGRSISVSEATNVRAPIETLSSLFKELEQADTQHVEEGDSDGILRDIIVEASNVDNELFDGMVKSSGCIDPSVKEYCPRAIESMGRYHRIARTFVDIGRNPRYRQLENLFVQVIKRPPPSSTKLVMHNYDSCCERLLSSQNGPHLDSSSILFDTRIVTKYENCRRQQEENPNIRKLHAEIQILLFYEQNHSLLRPRWICSNKSACYLCDEFIKAHGCFQTPSSHGRIYTGWRLPETLVIEQDSSQRLRATITRLNAQLERKILERAQMITLRRLPPPYESALNLGHVWTPTSTIVTMCSPVFKAEDRKHRQKQESLGKSTLIEPPTPPSSRSSQSSVTSYETIRAGTQRTGSSDNPSSCRVSNQPRFPSESVYSSALPAKAAPITESKIPRDAPSEMSLAPSRTPSIYLPSEFDHTERLKDAHRITRIHTPALKLYVSHDDPDRDHTLRVTTHKRQSSKGALNHGDDTVVDIQSLLPGKKYTFETGNGLSSKTLRLVKGQHVANLRFGAESMKSV